MAVWLRGTESAAPFISGEVVQAGPGNITVRSMAGGGETHVVLGSAVTVYPAGGRTAPDHCALPYLNEPSVLENTCARYMDNAIYTYISEVLVACNPFTRLPLYGREIMQTFVGIQLGSAPPHVYAIGEAAYCNICEGSTTAVVMSGESGSGKTETTKHLLDYITWSSERQGGGRSTAGASSGSLAGTLAQRLLSSSPLFEAFGNCKTVRNNNSSRFGKMMRLHFWPAGHAHAGQVAGGFIMTCAAA